MLKSGPCASTMSRHVCFGVLVLWRRRRRARVRVLLEGGADETREAQTTGPRWATRGDRRGDLVEEERLEVGVGQDLRLHHRLHEGLEAGFTTKALVEGKRAGVTGGARSYRSYRLVPLSLLLQPTAPIAIAAAIMPTSEALNERIASKEPPTRESDVRIGIGRKEISEAVARGADHSSFPSSRGLTQTLFFASTMTAPTPSIDSTS